MRPWVLFMKDGFYWIQYQGLVQMALFLKDEVENLDTGETLEGSWLLTGGFEICHDGHIKVISGPLDIVV